MFELPALPALDVAQYLQLHEAFVTTHNHRAFNSPTHESARDALAAAFEETGLDVWRQEFTNGIDQENICAAQLGVGDPGQWVVVGGHYDTHTWDAALPGVGVGLGEDAPNGMVSQGAYDDGSGTWMVVELAKSFSQIDTYYSVLYCAFDGEERGLQGSRAVHTAMKETEKFPWYIDETRAMFNIDMFGLNWPIRAPIYVDENNAPIRGFLDGLRKEMGIPDDMFKFMGLTLGQSDYAHWYGARDDYTPTVFFIADFEELGVPTPVENPAPVPGIPGAYPFWHFTDTVETMTLMAGGPDMLAKGFQTGLDLASHTLYFLAVDPSVVLEEAERGDGPARTTHAPSTSATSVAPSSTTWS